MTPPFTWHRHDKQHSSTYLCLQHHIHKPGLRCVIKLPKLTSKACDWFTLMVLCVDVRLCGTCYWVSLSSNSSPTLVLNALLSHGCIKRHRLEFIMWSYFRTSNLRRCFCFFSEFELLVSGAELLIFGFLLICFCKFYTKLHKWQNDSTFKIYAECRKWAWSHSFGSGLFCSI